MAKPFSVTPASHSSMSAYETCPKQFYHLRVAKDVQQAESPEMAWGNAVHKALENAVKYGRPLPSNMSIYQWGLDLFEQRKPDTVLHAELSVAVTRAFEPAGFWDANGFMRGKIDVVCMSGDNKQAINGDWKGLPLDTALPTPKGWTTMGEVRVGDRLFTRLGAVCRVVGKSEVKHLDCYEITFDDKTKVCCDAEHLWTLADGSVLPVTELRPRHLIPVTKALRLPKQDLPLDPYVLGIWLADGKHTSLEITKPDQCVWDEIQRRGFELGHDSASARGSCRTHSVLGIRSALTNLGVMGNKHIPMRYLRASRQQRLELLQGIMDGDGTANTARGTVVLDSTREIVVRGVHELLHSLGQRPNWASFSKTGYGVTSTVYRTSFTPIDIEPFLAGRKRDIFRSFAPKKNRSWRRSVVSVAKIDSVPTQCIKVDSIDETFLCTEHFIPTHNTGKTKPNSAQLALSTLLCFHTYAELEKMRTVFVWLPETDPRKRLTRKLYIRRDGDRIDTQDDRGKYITTSFEEMWEPFINIVDQMEWSLQHDTWPANPSGLCKAWCPVLSCPHNGKRK